MKKLPHLLAFLLSVALLGVSVNQAQAQKGGARGVSAARAPVGRSVGGISSSSLGRGPALKSGGVPFSSIGAAARPVNPIHRPVSGIGTGNGYGAGYGLSTGYNNRGRVNSAGFVVGNYWTDPFYGFGGYGYPGYGYPGYGYGEFGFGGYGADPYYGGVPNYPPGAYNPGTYPPGGSYPPAVVFNGRMQVPPGMTEPELGPTPTAVTASVQINVPSPMAEVWFNGVKTQTTGMKREFVTPELPPGKVFTYEVRARWSANGKDFDVTRQLNVQAGSQSLLNFVAEDREQLPAPSSAAMPPTIKM
jgi:uncharacterized protein (TIGR03000 family)